MKYIKHALFLAGILLILTVSAQATVRIADNNFNAPTGDDIYPSIQAAINAADPGDFVYVQPSPTSYGSATIEKEIHLVGIGFNLDKDAPLSSTMLDVTFRNNIDNTSDASNSSVTGLTIRDIYTTIYSGAPTITLEGLKIFNCRIQELQNACCQTYAPVNNMELSGNYFTEVVDFANQATNVIVKNNLFAGNVYFHSTSPNSGVVSNNIFYASIGKNSQGDNLIIQNNNFIGATGSTFAFSFGLLDAIVVNNIFYGRTPSLVAGGASTSVNFQRSTYTNNLSFSTGDDMLPPVGGGVSNSGSGNLEATPPLFTNVPLLSTWSSAYDFTLQGGSLAIDAGTDVSDIGITGGPYPFSDTNFILKTTSIPTIQIFNTSTVINPGDDLDVRVKARAN